MKICVIIPTLNEEKNINKIFSKIKNTKIKLDILFVDDSSIDKSQNIDEIKLINIVRVKSHARSPFFVL